MTTPEQPPVDEPVPAAEPAPEGGDDLSAFEVAMAAIVLAALRSWLSKVRTAVNGDTQKYGSVPDSDEIMFLAQDWTTRVDNDIMPELVKVQHRGWGKIAPARRAFPDANAIMQQELQQARNLLVRIPNEIYDRVNAELIQSAALGEDVYHQARRVDRVLDVTGSQNWPGRSKVIAVTEVNRAYAASILAGAYQSQIDEGRPMFKRWDSSRDPRVREWHRAADGQTQPLSTGFRVGPETLQFPGDPDGLPHNVINCRCTLDILDGDEIRGR
jgi:predicted NUDIX family NTP pyrophosphohydrolase